MTSNHDMNHTAKKKLIAKTQLGFFFQYHGGTNFGRTSGGPYLTTSYDYDAPLDEFGEFIILEFVFLHLRM